MEMLMLDSTITQLKHILSEQLDVNIKPEEITLDVSLLEDGLGLDSIALVELISLIEENFNVQFGEDDLKMETFTNVQSLAQHIHGLTTPVPA
jgi:acyl carrier protein